MYSFFSRSISVEQKNVFLFIFYLTVVSLFYLLFESSLVAYAGQIKLPGQDETAKLEAAGTFLKMADTAMFSWIARFLAGLAFASAGWALKEQKFGVCIICCLGAIIIATTPMWVQNIFEIGGGGTLFSN